MANPQIENGYIRIANEIFKALYKIRIPGEARQCLDFIISKTYGYNKKEDMISLSQFQETGLSKQHICNALNILCRMNLVTKKGNALSLFTKKGNDIATTYCFNKNYESWRTLPKKVTLPILVTLPKKVIDVTEKGNRTLPILGTTKDNITKDNITKDNIRPEFPAEASGLYDLFIATLPENLIPKNQKRIDEWKDVLDKCNRLDHYTWEQIADIIDCFRDDSFWNKNFLSPCKLRLLNKDKVKYIDYFWENMKSDYSESNGKDILGYIKKLTKEWYER